MKLHGSFSIENLSLILMAPPVFLHIPSEDCNKNCKPPN
jgi:hypothetical protein